MRVTLNVPASQLPDLYVGKEVSAYDNTARGTRNTVEIQFEHDEVELRPGTSSSKAGAVAASTFAIRWLKAPPATA